MRILDSVLEKERSIGYRNPEFQDILDRGMFNYDFLKKMIEDRGGIYKSNGSKQFFIEAELEQVSKDVKEFWSINKNKVYESILAISGLCTVVVNPLSFDELRHLPIYFDCVLIEDTFNSSITAENRSYLAKHDEKSHAFKIGGLAVLLGDYFVIHNRVRASLNAETEHPIYIVYPQRIVFREKEEYQKKIRNIVYPRIKENLNINSEDIDIDIEDYINKMSLDESTTTLRQLKASKEWQNTVKEKDAIINFDGTLRQSSSQLELQRRLLIHYKDVKTLRVKDAIRLETHSTELHAIRGTSHFDWNSVRDVIHDTQKQMGNTLGISEEYIGMSALQLDELMWLSNISWDSLKMLREHGKMDEMRSYFRTTKRNLANASLDEFKKVGRSAADELLLLLKEQEKKLSQEKKDYIKKFSLSVSSFSVGMTLGLGTALFPALAPLSIPATILSGLIGTSSAKDLIKLHISRKKRIEKLSIRPISVLLSAKTIG